MVGANEVLEVMPGEGTMSDYGGDSVSAPLVSSAFSEVYSGAIQFDELKVFVCAVELPQPWSPPVCACFRGVFVDVDKLLGHKTDVRETQ